MQELCANRVVSASKIPLCDKEIVMLGFFSTSWVAWMLSAARIVHGSRVDGIHGKAGTSWASLAGRHFSLDLFYTLECSGPRVKGVYKYLACPLPKSVFMILMESGSIGTNHNPTYQYGLSSLTSASHNCRTLDLLGASTQKFPRLFCLCSGSAYA